MHWYPTLPAAASQDSKSDLKFERRLAVLVKGDRVSRTKYASY